MKYLYVKSFVIIMVSRVRANKNRILEIFNAVSSFMINMFDC
jgi:hypothetical protein